MSETWGGYAAAAAAGNVAGYSMVLRLRAASDTGLGFELLDEPEVDEWGQVGYGRWGGWLIGVSEMLVNERLCLWDERAGGLFLAPEFGWCYYPKRGPALRALCDFRPAEQGEPVGYAKRALGVRAAGQTAPDWTPQVVVG